MSELRRNVVIVTGAAGGIGSATVDALAARGVSVFAVDLDWHAIPATSGGDVCLHSADVSKKVDVVNMMGAAVNQFGGVDAVFNNAGIFGAWAPLAEYPDETFARVFAVNVTGVQLVMKHAIPVLREAGGGVILNTASTGALTGVANASAYVAAKHAVLGLTRAVALELQSDHIAVNALCPGSTDTAMIAEIADAAGVSLTEPLISASDVARVATWLLLDAPRSLTGVPITVADGRVV
jgi:3alpha(or 20beta)-hydroxysteroid dehydrogenase